MLIVFGFLISFRIVQGLPSGGLYCTSLVMPTEKNMAAAAVWHM